MILISVISDAMQVKRQFEKEKDAEKYLLFVKKFHDMDRRNRLGQRPSAVTHKGKLSAIEYDNQLKTILPCKIEIINTDANQLTLQPL